MMRVAMLLLTVPLLLTACNKEGGKDSPGETSGTDAWACQLVEGSDPDYATQLGCQGDYDILSSQPADASIPGATSVKTVIDRVDSNNLYFQNSKRYCIHWDFASTHLSGDGLPIVPELGQFNSTEYYSPDRRFLLGALSHYSGPGAWVYEISPYDTASAEMIETAYLKIKENLWNGDELAFHATSVTVEREAALLSDAVTQISTDALYAGVDYQPLNPGTSTGILRFHSADEVDGTYTPFREIVVLDAVPNDISIVAGIITAEFQTPLAHINVLSVNRGTPNMALRDAQQEADLLALEGKWVELTVGPFDWSIREITEAEADVWWDGHRPVPLTVQPMDLDVTELRRGAEMIDLEQYALGDAISGAIPIFGAKATNYGALEEAASLGHPIPVQPGYGIPMYYYNQFMEDNGLWARIAELMALPEWSDPAQRSVLLEAFKDEMRDMPMRPEVVQMIKDRSAEIFPGENSRFRSSTNSEDLGAFTGAGLYNSETGDPSVPDGEDDSIEWAVKKVWSQVWNPRAYEEREFYSMNHLDVGMGLLVHSNYPDEEANGVAVTNNPFDTTGLEPAFYVNGQEGSEDVVTPDPGVLPDSYIHYFYNPGQPIVYIQHSTEIPDSETVLTTQESYDLAVALDAINTFFREAYDTGGWYGLEVDWKFDDKYTPGTPTLWIKQARPYPGWSSDATGGCTPE
jgi:Pyruvate phosphate dikinase, AMP/ATP-binding domain